MEANTAQCLQRAFQNGDPWVPHEAIFRELYCIKGKTLKEVKEEMEMSYGFPSAPLSTYETKLRDVLMLRKNLTKIEWRIILDHIRRRKAEGKTSQVFLNGVPLSNDKVCKELRRNKSTLHAKEPTHTVLPLGVDINTPPALPFLSPIQSLQLGPPSNTLVPHDTAAVLGQIQQKISHDTTSSISVISETLQVNQHDRKRSENSAGDYVNMSKTGTSFLDDGHPASDILLLSSSPTMIAQQYPYSHISSQIQSKDDHQVVSSLSTDSKASREAFSSRKRPLGMPYPTEIPQFTRIADQIPQQLLSATLRDVPHEQFPLDSSRIIDNVPNEEFRIGRRAMSSLDFLSTTLFFVSNGLLDLGGETALIKNLENQNNQQATIDALFSINTPTVRAAWEKLIRLVIERQSSLYGPLLLAGCRKRDWIAGLAPTLECAAIQFFDSVKAIEHIRRLRRAQVSLVEGAMSIDLGDGTFLGDPLQQALNRADAEIVRELMSDTHVPDSAGEHRRERLLYIPENFSDGFCENPEEQRMACLKAMVDCGLRLNEPADHGYDDNRRLGCVLPLHCYNTLDHLFELGLGREYEMLLPYSRKFSKSAMVCGILSAAINGDHALSEYLTARTLTMDEDLLILKEIALCKTVFLPEDHRYTVLHCLLRNGVDPNIPHLSTYFHHSDDGHVDTAVRNHDLKYLAILLGRDLAIDSARMLRSLFCKRFCDEHLEPLSTRLRTLGFLRDNGLNVRVHGMVALAAFLAGGYWSRSDSEVSPPLSEILTLLRTLLDAGADVNTVIDTRGNTILHATAGARFASPDIITALIEAGANIQALNLDGRTVLQEAIVCYKPSRLAIVECLFKHGAVVTYNGQGSTILEDLVMYAGTSFHRYPVDIAALFEMLLSRGASINNPNLESGPSALALLIQNSMPSELIQMALEAGADVNAPVILTTGFYPIQAAVEAGNSPVLMDLLNRGARINAPAARNSGRTALQSACLLGRPGLVQDLLARGADVNAPAGYKNGLTALQAAAMAGEIVVANMLIENRAQLDLPPAIKNGNLPLDGAAMVGRLDMVQYLMNLGAISQEPGATRYDGAIKLAERNGHYAVADLMREHGARLDKENGLDDQTLLVNYPDQAALEGLSTDISSSTILW